MATAMVGVLNLFWGRDDAQLSDEMAWTRDDSLDMNLVDAFVVDSALQGEELWQDGRARARQADSPKGPLSHFVAALERSKRKPGTVRIGYFGDSMIEGDLVTQSLRKDMQDLFGGTGVGFVPITSKVNGFRKSIKHDFSEDWKDYSLLTPQPPPYEFGISGEVFLARKAMSTQQTWVRYEATDLYPQTESFHQVRLFYGNRGDKPLVQNSYVIVQSDQGVDTVQMNGQGEVNTLQLLADHSGAIELKFRIPSDLPVFGLSFESDQGIQIDNFASRGNSGLNLVEIPSDILEGFHTHMDYDLIVLQFGLNVVSTQRKSFRGYERGMKRVIQHFKTYMPNTDLLLVSVSDKSTRINGTLQTDPSVPLIVEAQKRVAEEMDIAFLDLFRGMGGYNTMIKWVQAKPALAQKDYTHPNRRGAERLSRIVRSYLLKAYETETGLEAKAGSVAMQ